MEPCQWLFLFFERSIARVAQNNVRHEVLSRFAMSRALSGVTRRGVSVAASAQVLSWKRPLYDGEMTKPSPLATLGGAVGGFRKFAAEVRAGVPGSKVGSTAELDQNVTGNPVIPHGIVTGLVLAAADHLDAWAELADSPGEGTLLLHVNADYTLFRPVIEALTEVIWILDGDTSEARIKRALEVAKVEYRHGLALTSALNKASTPDEKTSAGIAALGRLIKSSAESVGLDAVEFIKADLVDPSALTKKIAHRVPGPTLQTLRYWAITSAHAHGQLISTLRFAVETALEAPHNRGSLIEPDEALIAELIQFIAILLKVAIDLLNEQGYVLAKA